MSIFIAALLLSGCLGGTVAQQIVRSIATSVADKTIANAMDVNENAEPRPRQSITLQSRPPSELSRALTTTSFKTVNKSSEQAVLDVPVETDIQIIRASSLVSVKLFNLIIGDEKKAVYENARRIGALNLPKPEEWKSWYVATGMIENSKERVTFLIPPKLGKLPSGSNTIVELANTGDLNIARYTLSERKVFQAMDQSNHSASQ